MKCAILRPSANGTQVIKFEDPVTCNAAELSGDTVIYYGFDYDLAAETITNTSGVKRKFLGDAKFTTTNVGGTFGGIPTGTTINDLTAVAVDCAIASVPIALPADLVKASDSKFYKKNLAGDAWEALSLDTYTALLSQSSTSAPTATVLWNSFTSAVTLTRPSVGNYKLSISGGFTLLKTFVMLLGVSQYLIGNKYVRISFDVDNNILIETFDSSAEYADGVLDKFPLEIKIYP